MRPELRVSRRPSFVRLHDTLARSFLFMKTEIENKDENITRLAELWVSLCFQHLENKYEYKDKEIKNVSRKKAIYKR